MGWMEVGWKLDGLDGKQTNHLCLSSSLPRYRRLFLCPSLPRAQSLPISLTTKIQSQTRCHLCLFLSANLFPDKKNFSFILAQTFRPHHWVSVGGTWPN